jgi:hypothetical protein
MASDYVGRRARLVQKGEATLNQVTRTYPPAPAVLRYVGPVLFGRPGRLFFARQTGASKMPPHGGHRTGRNAVPVRLGPDFNERDVWLGVQDRANQAIMRLQDRATVPTNGGRSRIAALAEAPHQLHRGRGAHIKAQRSLMDRRATLDRTHDPITQITRRNWRGTPCGSSQPPLLNQPSQFQASAPRSNRRLIDTPIRRRRRAPGSKLNCGVTFQDKATQPI